MIEPPEGLLAVDKPAGPTSHAVVASIRARAGAERAGHTGTLDPGATGLLLVLLGRATRLALHVPSTPKTYEGALRLGLTTLTDDVHGDVLSRHGGPLPDADRVVQAAAGFVGRSMQVPPSVSARKVGGERLHRAARRGRALEAPPTPIDVASLTLEPTDDPARFRFRAVVSAGTFVRGIVRDMGRALGCGAIVETLRRTAIATFDVAHAAASDRLPGAPGPAWSAAIVPLDAIPLALPSLALEGAGARDAFVHGRILPAPAAAEVAAGLVAVRDAAGALLGVGRLEDGRLLPRTVLGPPERFPRLAGLPVV